MKHSIPTALAFVWVFALFLAMSGCSFDPWPEPDPSDDDDSAADYEADDETGGQETDDDEGTEDGEGDNDASLTDATAIYCSAPNPEGIVTVVGVPGAVQTGGGAVLVWGEDGQSQSFVVSEDGSFAGRIDAQPSETLSIQALGEGVADTPVSVVAGVLEWGNVGESIVGPGGGAGAPSDSGGGGSEVSVQGEGEALQAGLVVIAGNVDLSVGESTEITCDTACQFELFIQGEAGDEIDLFLVWDGQNSGVTDSQTEVVPE